MANITGKDIGREQLLDMEKRTLDSLIGKQYQQIKDYFGIDLTLKDIMYLYKNSMLAVNLMLGIGQDLQDIEQYEIEKKEIIEKIESEQARKRGEM